MSKQSSGMQRYHLHRRNLITAYVRESARVTRKAAGECAPEIAAAAKIITLALGATVSRPPRKLLICGNGGSAADSQHIATEFMSTLTRDFFRHALPAIALTTDTSFLTAFSNDFGFDDVFARQVEALGQKGDVLLSLSTSGNSENVVRAMRQAKKAGMFNVLFTGETGGLAAIESTVCVRVPSKVTGHIQEAHIALAHALCRDVEFLIYGKREAK